MPPSKDAASLLDPGAMPTAVIGEILALLGAAAYGLAGLAILRGQAAARADNGVFLSVAMTAALSLVLWIWAGSVPLRSVFEAANLRPLVYFVLAGLASMGLGRLTMFRATVHVGAVRASLLRRLTPVFAITLAYLFLGETPQISTLLGGAVILGGVLLYLAPARDASRRMPLSGLLVGSASALFYALSYILRRMGLEGLPDAALGTCLGAISGAVWMLATVALRPGRGIITLITDRSAWHWLAAVALSAGQLLQFFALKSASVAAVSIFGSLEVIFTAVLVVLFQPAETVARGRLALATMLTLAGTFLVVTR
ncbi:MAG: EamA family transporter [Tabrizicola sp.]